MSEATLGRYTLLDRIGQGGMAEIWRAKATGPSGFQKTVAIKRVLPHLVEQEKFIEMFIAEAKLAARLEHPNIVRVYDFGEAGRGNYYIAMEYVAGANLATVLKILRRRGIKQMPVDLALYIVAEAAKGLDHAHHLTDENGEPISIIHRDISPHNLLLSYDGEVKVTDFGIAKVAGALGSTATGMVKGKLNYMSPEQACQQPMDHRSDIFSLGVTLYEMLVGEPLFDGETVPDIAMKILHYTGPPAEKIQQLPKPVCDVIRSALQRDPGSRYRRAVHMEEDIVPILGIAGVKNARQALGTVVTKLIPKEESGSVPAVQVPPVTGENDPTLAQGPVPAPREATLENLGPRASDAHDVTLEATPSAVRQVTPLPAPRPRRTWPVVLVGGALLAAAAAFVGFRFGPGLLGRGPQAAAVPTASPAETPVEVSLFDVPATPSLPPAVTPKPTRAPRTPRTPRPHATPMRTASVSSTAAVVPTAANSAASSGALTITARPWVEVWVDGKRVKKETPLVRHPLAAGTHTVRFVNEPLHFNVSRQIKVERDSVLKLYVDVSANKIEVTR